MSLSVARSVPSNSTWPVVGVSIAPSKFSSVLLPEPEGPTSPASRLLER